MSTHRRFLLGLCIPLITLGYFVLPAGAQGPSDLRIVFTVTDVKSGAWRFVALERPTLSHETVLSGPEGVTQLRIIGVPDPAKVHFYQRFESVIMLSDSKNGRGNLNLTPSVPAVSEWFELKNKLEPDKAQPIKNVIYEPLPKHPKYEFFGMSWINPRIRFPAPLISSSEIQMLVIKHGLAHGWSREDIGFWQQLASSCSTAYTMPCGVFPGRTRYRLVQGDPGEQQQTLAEFTILNSSTCCEKWPCDQDYLFGAYKKPQQGCGGSCGAS